MALEVGEIGDLEARLEVKVSEMLQCADPEVFRPDSAEDTAREVCALADVDITVSIGPP